MKKTRHETILRIIKNNCVSTQSELLEKLNEEGFDTTQATISRDIKDLHLIKKTDQFGRPCYTAEETETVELTGQYSSVFEHSVISADYAGNMLAVKCYNGMANAACAALDVMNWDGIVGTLAGDDTFFVLCRSEETAKELKSIIENIIR